MSSTQFDGDIDSFVSYLKSNRGLSANTLKAYRADLTACLHLFELRGVTDLNEITRAFALPNNPREFPVRPHTVCR